MSEGRLRIALEIEDSRWLDAVPEVVEILERSVGLALAGVDTPRPIEVGVRLVDDGAIQGLNREWRGRNAPTNVLSFPLGDPGPVTDREFPWLIGDIVMSYDTVASEARGQEKPLDHHIAHLAIHAALHLIGHDHLEDAEAEAMEAAEIKLLAELGIANPYLTETPEARP